MTMFFLLPAILLSGFAFPFMGMPAWAQVIGEVLPATHFLRIVRGILLKDNGMAGNLARSVAAVPVHLRRRQRRPAALPEDAGLIRDSGDGDVRFWPKADIQLLSKAAPNLLVKSSLVCRIAAFGALRNRRIC